VKSDESIALTVNTVVAITWADSLQGQATLSFWVFWKAFDVAAARGKVGG